MILWHAGVAAAIVYVTLGRARIDYRFVLLGAVAPDLIDGALSVAAFGYWEGRGISHTLLTVVVVAVVVILGTRGTTRLALFGLPVGWLLHLVGDGMWNLPELFLWPAFGTTFGSSEPYSMAFFTTTFPSSPEPYSWTLVTDPLSHLGTWGGELVGVALLAWFVVAFGLTDPARRAAFVRDGHLRA